MKLTPEILEVLRIRRDFGKTSTGKLPKMLQTADEDGRIRNASVYHGAGHTGREAGQGFQPHNFPRGTFPKGMEQLCVETLHGLLEEDPETVELLLGPVMPAVSSSLRSFIKAGPGKIFRVSDFKSIETCVLAWMADEQDMLAALQSGSDLYSDMAEAIYVGTGEVPVRQVGKFAILGLGYNMGPDRFRETLAGIGIEVTRKFAVHVVKIYRDKYPNIVGLWKAFGNAAIESIENPHQTKIDVGRCGVFYDGQCLLIELPSGRRLHYWYPKIGEVIAPWSRGFEGELAVPLEDQDWLEELGVRLGEYKRNRFWEVDIPVQAWGSVQKRYRGTNGLGLLRTKKPKKIKQVQFMSVNGPAKKWQRDRTYGGKLVENAVQAAARDLLFEGMHRLERAGYSLVLDCHDEAMSEDDIDFGSLDKFNRIFAQMPPWARGCPISVEGYEAERYRK